MVLLMSEFSHSESSDNFPAFAIGRDENVTYTADGTAHVESSANIYNMEPEEFREAFAEARGIDTDDVTIDTVNGVPYDRPRGRDKSRAAFSSKNWNSSWNPSIDPNAN